MDEGRKRVLAIVAGILVSSPETTEDLNDCHASPRTGYLFAAAAQWADRIMRKIDNVLSRSCRVLRPLYLNANAALSELANADGYQYLRYSSFSESPGTIAW
jgi:hypothetical protein